MERKLDKLGRIVIPKEFRKKNNWSEYDEIEIIEKEDQIILRKYKNIHCPICLTRCNHTDKYCSNCGFKFEKRYKSRKEERS